MNKQPTPRLLDLVVGVTPASLATPAPAPALPAVPYRSERFLRRQWIMEAYGIAPRRRRDR